MGKDRLRGIKAPLTTTMDLGISGSWHQTLSKALALLSTFKLYE